MLALLLLHLLAAVLAPVLVRWWGRNAFLALALVLGINAMVFPSFFDLAVRTGCDGAHLGQEDGDPREARELLGPSVQIGVTCHDSRHLAMSAGEAGADYVAFGAFHPSATKDKGPDAERPDIELLSWWSHLFEIPCVAIGGITPANCRPLAEAGADFLAVSGGVWNGDEAEAIAAFRKALTQ